MGIISIHIEYGARDFVLHDKLRREAKGCVGRA